MKKDDGPGNEQRVLILFGLSIELGTSGENLTRDVSFRPLYS